MTDEVKAGQVYLDILDLETYMIIAITNVNDGMISMINQAGVTDDIHEKLLPEQDWRLLAEYPTWQEAVNSKEFKENRDD